MSIFSAEETETLGKRAIRLVHQINQFDRTPRTITLIVKQELPGYTRFPAAYEYLEESSERPYPIIRIVAGPGVSALLQNFPDVQLVGPASDIPDVEIYRVQDPEVVPPMAIDITPFGFTGSDEVNPPSSPLADAPSPENYFQIERLPTQVIIKHVVTSTTLILKVPQFSRNTVETRDAQARFAYEIDPAGILGSADQPLLKIVKTPAVDIEVAEPSRIRFSFQNPRDPRQFLSFYQVYEVDDINAVPPQGYEIIPDSGWRRVQGIRRVPMLEEEFLMAAFDISVGLSPYIGDFADVAELIYGISTGRDKWGHKVTVGQLVIMGVCALLPFIGSAALRQSSRLIQKFRRRAQTVQELIEILRRASITAEEADLLRAMEDLIRSGKNLTPDMLQRFSALVRRVRGQYPSIEMLLNAERTGFIHPKLQEAYQRYRHRLIRRAGRPVSPREWAFRQTSGPNRPILEALFGPDYVARGYERFMNIKDIPRAIEYDDKLVRADLDILHQESDKATERLDTLLADRTMGGPLTRYLSRIRINVGHFRILKGNIGEILSRPRQLAILREVRNLAKENANAVLITGVRMRLKGNLRSVLFTDNIIAVKRGDNLHILAVFEVKSGYEGGLEAQSQIFRWIEDRITDGSQLVIPSRARIVDVDGTEKLVGRERTFTFKPKKSDIPQIMNLNSAKRYLITARGSSHLGIDSPEQVAATVQRIELRRSSAEMDFLAGQFLASIRW